MLLTGLSPLPHFGHSCLPMLLVLLVAYKDGELRTPHHVSLQQDQAGKRKRGQRWNLPADTWFQTAAARAQLVYRPDCGVVSMLVKLRPGTQCSGLLTPWNAYEALQWQYFGRPRHAYSWMLDGDAIHLHTPLKCGPMRYKGSTRLRSFVLHDMPLHDNDSFGRRAVPGWRPDSPGEILSCLQVRQLCVAAPRSGAISFSIVR